MYISRFCSLHFSCTWRAANIMLHRLCCAVLSVLLYGCEAWATTLADCRRLDVFDMRCQRRLLRVFWQQHISNHSIHERTKQPTASSLLRQRRLRWFGHLHHMPSSLPIRRVYDFNPNIHGWKRHRPCSHCYSGTVIRHKFVPAQHCRHIGARSH